MTYSLQVSKTCVTKFYNDDNFVPMVVIQDDNVVVLPPCSKIMTIAKIQNFQQVKNYTLDMTFIVILCPIKVSGMKDVSTTLMFTHLHTCLIIFIKIHILLLRVEFPRLISTM